MYYIVEHNYHGPNPDQHIDRDTIEIWTTPALGNSSREPVIDGWCGTTNNWACYAHGEFLTLEEAEAAIDKIFGDTRFFSPSDEPLGAWGDEVVAIYKPGRYAEMSYRDVADWIYEALRDLTADTTDEQLKDLADDLESEANYHECTLSGHHVSILEDHVEALKAAAEAEAEFSE